VQELFDAIRQECSPSVWSRGVELVRAEAVRAEEESDREICLRVSTRGGMVAPLVTLYPEDLEWECDCSSRENPCEHVAAAAIALRRSRREGRDLSSPGRGAGRIRYCFTRHQGGLSFEREIVQGEQCTLLTTTLEAIASGRVDGPAFAASRSDIDVELALGSRRRGPMPREAMPRLLDCLAGCDDIRLDGEPIRVSRERVVPQGYVEDAPGGFRVSIAQDPRVTHFFNNGVSLCGDTLRIVGPSRLSGRELEDLPEGRFYSDDQAVELVTEVLPSLMERIPVDIQTERLPRVEGSEPPRIALQVSRQGESLSVLPTLVYGDPPWVRIDAGRLVLLGGAIPVRDEAAERRLVRHLHNQLELAPGHRVELRGEEAIALASKLEHWGGEIRGDAHRLFYRAPELVPRLQIEGSHLELDFESPLDGAGPGRGSRRVSGEAVLRAWNGGESLVALSGGGFAPLPEDWLRCHGHRVADLLAARREDGEIPRCALADLAALCEELDHPAPPAIQEIAPLLGDAHGIPQATLPEDLRGSLRPYQRRGVDWLCFLRSAELGALLADDMGLGKTVQALCAVEGRSLVVAPTSVLHNWVEETARFRPGLRCSLYHGPGRALDPEADLTLTSYALLRLDAEKLGEERWDCVVLDEAQAIKNPESQVARAACALHARYRIALTGTPIENRLEELWSQLHFLNRGLLGGRRDFQDRVVRPIFGGDETAAERLRQRIRPFLLRRLKREVAPELPPRTELVLHCVLGEEERRVYETVRAATRREVVAKLAARAEGSVMAALEALLRLRQAACHPALVPGQQAASTSSKLELLLGRLEEAVADGHKALVFSQWTALLDRVEPLLAESRIEFLRLDGSTRDRGAVVGGFQTETGPPVMLVSLRAGGTGLNLTAADHIFLLDPWWNPAVEDQAADRAHRIGQSRPVMVHRLVAQDTVEEGILELQSKKRSLSDLAMGEADRAASLSREELLKLLA
jgi:superfamily II DNA or RNA helicase